MYRPGQVFGLSAGTAGGLYDLPDDLLEGMNLIVEENDGPRLVGARAFVFLFHLFDLRGRRLYVRFRGCTNDRVGRNHDALVWTVRRLQGMSE